jgi:hypothetical protein
MDLLAERDGIAALDVARNEPSSLPEYWQGWGGFEGLPGNLSGKSERSRVVSSVGPKWHHHGSS